MIEVIQTEKKSSPFCSWFRRYGIRIWFIFTFLVSWILYNSTIVENTRPPMPLFHSKYEMKEIASYFATWCIWLVECLVQEIEIGLFQLSPQVINKYGLGPTLWLLLFRLGSLFCLCGIIRPGFAALLSNPLPFYQENEDEVVNRHPIHCLCLRTITRGDKSAHALVRRSITNAIKLINDMFQCEHLKVHIVTETRFLDERTKQVWLGQGVTEVKELFVPKNYSPAKGTLFRARNICYWRDAGGLGVECDETRSWILTLDEESLITKPLLASFIKDVLQSNHLDKIGYAFGFSTVDVELFPMSLIAIAAEASFLGRKHAEFMQKEESTAGSLDFQGGADFSRATIDRIIGYDVGPQGSLAEDYATAFAAAENGIIIKRLQGWSMEAPPPTLRSRIAMRSRTLCGYFTVICCRPIGLQQKMLDIGKWLLGLIGCLSKLFFIGCVIIAPSAFTPAGPSCTTLDLALLLFLNFEAFFISYGSLYMRLNDEKMIGCALISPFVAFIGICAIESVAVFYALGMIVRYWMTGSLHYDVTPKKYARPCETKKRME